MFFRDNFHKKTMGSTRRLDYWTHSTEFGQWCPTNFGRSGSSFELFKWALSSWIWIGRRPRWLAIEDGAPSMLTTFSGPCRFRRSYTSQQNMLRHRDTRIIVATVHPFSLLVTLPFLLIKKCWVKHPKACCIQGKFTCRSIKTNLSWYNKYTFSLGASLVRSGKYPPKNIGSFLSHGPPWRLDDWGTPMILDIGPEVRSV